MEIRAFSWYFLLLIPILIYLFYRKRKKSAIKFPSISMIKKAGLKTSKKYLIGKNLIFLSMLFLTIALIRPQKIDKNKKIKKDGIDIVMVMDISQSMLAEDFKPNRLEVAKEVINDFVDGRVNDRISLVVFAGSAYTRVPLTLDYEVLNQSLMTLSIKDIIDNNRTAIGLGTATAINRLKKSEAKSKIIILVTDGENNAGEISPENAIILAKEMGIKLYTVGVGADYIQQNTFFGVRNVKNTALDEKLLVKMAKDTGGYYFRARDEESFKEIFKKINEMETSKLEAREIFLYTELYKPFVIIGLVLLILGLYFDRYKYIKIP